MIVTYPQQHHFLLAGDRLVQPVDRTTAIPNGWKHPVIGNPIPASIRQLVDALIGDRGESLRQLRLQNVKDELIVRKNAHIALRMGLLGDCQ